ncbi:MAG: hypothetical protein A2X53_11895 [Candidatus Rokubacteria bacterium GWA2_70_23]|nr:MAG: hypothetical protein A2X53_11895 [Candidatus Rokubacteria bacterium GWA2_70_23]
MIESSREGNGQRIELSVVPVASRNGPPPVQATDQARYCAFCGAEVGQEGAPERFGEIFCSDAHAEEFVKGVRAVRVQTAVAGGAEVQRTDGTAPEQPTGAAKPWDWKMALKMAACCGAPLLALVVLAGGGGALLGAAGALLPLLALLACPLGMYFMMRGRSTGHQQQPKDEDHDK